MNFICPLSGFSLHRLGLLRTAAWPLLCLVFPEKLDEVVTEGKKAAEAGKKVNAFDDPVPQAEKEIKDLKEILPDILAKVR